MTNRDDVETEPGALYALSSTVLKLCAHIERGKITAVTVACLSQQAYVYVMTHDGFMSGRKLDV